MPVIRQYGPQVDPVDASVGRPRNIPSEAFGTAQARAAKTISRELSSLGGALIDYAEQEEALDVQAKLADKQSELTRKFEQEYKSADPNDKEFADRFLRSAKEELDKIEPNLITRSARIAYEKNRGRMVRNFTDKALLAQSQLAGMKAVNDYGTVKNKLSSALVTSPADFKGNLEQHNDAIQRLIDTGSIDPKHANQLKQEGTQQLAVSSVQGWIELNPENAYKKLKDGEFDEFLDGTKKAQLMRAAKSRSTINGEISSSREFTLKEMRQRDPWRFAAQKEIEFKKPQLNLSDPEYFKKLEVAREDFVEQYPGVKPPLFTDAEVSVLKEDLFSGNSELMTQRLNFLRDQMLPRQYNEFSKELFSKEPEIGVALGISNESMGTAQKIILGKKVLEDKSFAMDIDENQMKQTYSEYLGDSIDPGNSQFRENSYFAVKALIAQKVREGSINSSPSSDDIRNAAKEIYGPTFDYKGSKMISFKDKKGEWVDSTYFDQIIEESTDEELFKHGNGMPLNISGEPFTKEDIEDHAKFQVVGYGKYILKMGDRYALDQSGRPYVLDMKGLEENFKQDRVRVEAIRKGLQGL